MKPALADPLAPGHPTLPAVPGIQGRSNRIGIAWMVLAMTAFIANDSIVKTVVAHMAFAQMVVVRGIMAIMLILLVAWRMGALPRIRRAASAPVLLRASFEGAATFLYLAALLRLPLASATAIQMSSPVFIALLARLVLGERVDRLRWLAIGIGFCGVLLVIQPSADGFNSAAWLCLCATLCFAIRDLLTRRIPNDIASILITLTTALVVVSIAALVLLVQGWQPVGGREIGLLAMAAVCLSTGYYSVIAALRYGEASVVAPFRYSGLLWAVLAGYLLWGDLPNALAWSGIAMLVGAGLLMIHQQRRR